jgi:hypothetical protein
MENKEIKQFVKDWMDGHEPDTFVRNKYGEVLYTAGHSYLNLTCFFENLLEDYVETISNTLCSCGVPSHLHNTSCGWENASRIITPKTSQEEEWQKLQTEATANVVANFSPQKQFSTLPAHISKGKRYSGYNDKHGIPIYEGDEVGVDNGDRGEDTHVETICKFEDGFPILEDQAGGQWTRQLYHQQYRLTVNNHL